MPLTDREKRMLMPTEKPTRPDVDEVERALESGSPHAWHDDTVAGLCAYIRELERRMAKSHAILERAFVVIDPETELSDEIAAELDCKEGGCFNAD